MGGAPFPSLPAVRRPDLQGILPLLPALAQIFEHPGLTSVGGMDDFRFAVTVTLEVYRVRPVLLLNPFDFAGDDFGGFIPGNPLKPAFTAILRVPVTIRGPVDSF